jgi:D-3-phosphoglycerate dehydrogenase / 2-oxoglutarate reductase
MYKIKIYNKIDLNKTTGFNDKEFVFDENYDDPDSILVRSYKLHDMNINNSLKAIGRAGAGVNNIPVDLCTENSIVVFNTPGANANAVKEMVLTGMFLSARNIIGGIDFAKGLVGTEGVAKIVEANKSKFAGYEIKGKKLGVIGLGSIGMMVANDCVYLGLDVMGYDPFISVDSAWGLLREVKPAPSLDPLLENSDIISLHMPLTEKTKSFINEARLKKMKKGAVILNFARAEIVDEDAIITALDEGHLRLYVTDFPTDKLLKHNKVISIPHLGASTKEAEDNCAVMISEQVADYLENGNIKNAVNFPDSYLERTSEFRLVVINKNIPNMVGQITAVLAEYQINISEMLNKSVGDIAYNIVDINNKPSEDVLNKIKNIEGITKVRLLG